jgi:hypothetical protein
LLKDRAWAIGWRGGLSFGAREAWGGGGDGDEGGRNGGFGLWDGVRQGDGEGSLCGYVGDGRRAARGKLGGGSESSEWGLMEG